MSEILLPPVSGATGGDRAKVSRKAIERILIELGGVHISVIIHSKHHKPTYVILFL